MAATPSSVRVAVGAPWVAGDTLSTLERAPIHVADGNRLRNHTERRVCWTARRAPCGHELCLRSRSAGWYQHVLWPVRASGTVDGQ